MTGFGKTTAQSGCSVRKELESSGWRRDPKAPGAEESRIALAPASHRQLVYGVDGAQLQITSQGIHPMGGVHGYPQPAAPARRMGG
jgi:hypothetical protein